MYNIPHTALQSIKHNHHDPSTQKDVIHHPYPQAVRETLFHETDTLHRDRQDLEYI